MVASVNLGGIFMISLLTRAICARGWSVDTGAIVHVCGQRENFRTYRPMPPGMLVVYVDGHIAEVQGIGDACMKFTRDEWVTLRDVLNVPTIPKGLVSADKFEKGGFKMVLENGKIVITKGGRYVGREKNCSRMYHVEFFEDKFSRDDENSSHMTSSSTSQETLPPPPIVEEPKRSTRARIEKSFGGDFNSYLVKGTQKKVTIKVIFAINLDDDTKTFIEAMTSRDAHLWEEVINDEIDSIMGNGTWEYVDLS
ncbi:uncharacterized protein LOC111895809 [Lactuca sativa]|uniref:uncharacterized protein LOC111895809 n=1 Tax=Lactuca sativa TaxID=4236 RepID=UPI000CD811CD|nr:uncharacterized protein LOC111895809 [Lactuca sativa]